MSKRMRYIWITLLGCLFSAVVSAQHVNQTIEPQASISAFSSCMLSFNDTLLVYGFKRDSLMMPSNVLLKLNDNGEILQELNFSIPGREVRSQYKTMLEQDGFLYLGLSSRVNDDTAYSHLYKCTLSGDTVWTQQYGAATGQLIIYSLIAHPEGGFVLLGIVKEQVANESDIFILRTDTAGNELWRTYYGAQGISDGVNPSFVHIGEDEYFLGTSERIPVSGNPNVPYYYKTFLLKLRSNGSFWRKALSRPLQSEGTPLGIIKVSDGNFVYGSNLNNANIPYSTISKGLAVKIDSAGEVIWEKEIGQFATFTNLGLVRELPNGNLVFAGRMNKGTPLGQEAGWLVTLDSEGNSISQTTFIWPGYGTPDALSMALRDIILLPDGRVAGCGDIVTDKQRIWFFVSDQNGCFDQYCTYLGEQVAETTAGFAVYPNPSQDWLYVYNPYTGLPLNAKLLNLNGQTIFSTLLLHGETTNAIAVSELTSGIYFLQITLPNGKVVTEKIIKQ